MKREESMKTNKENDYKDLTNETNLRITYLNRRVLILEVIVGKIAQINGIKVERFQDGLVVIS